jgi:hypothetical protein
MGETLNLDLEGLCVEGVYRARLVKGEILTVGRRKRYIRRQMTRDELEKLLNALNEGDALLLTGSIEERVSGRQVELRQRRVIIAKLNGGLVMRDVVDVVHGERV